MISSGLGRSPVEKFALNTGVTNVTTAAYVQVSTATTKPSSLMEVFNQTTKIFILAVGAPGSEVDLPLYIYPGIISQLVPFDSMIPKGSRISVKALDATANSGYLLLNMYG